MCMGLSYYQYNTTPTLLTCAWSSSHSIQINTQTGARCVGCLDKWAVLSVIDMLYECYHQLIKVLIRLEFSIVIFLLGTLYLLMFIITLWRYSHWLGYVQTFEFFKVQMCNTNSEFSSAILYTWLTPLFRVHGNSCLLPLWLGLALSKISWMIWSQPSMSFFGWASCIFYVETRKLSQHSLTTVSIP